MDAALNRVWEALEANLLGAWRLWEMAVPLMRRHRYGRIVNVSSGMGATRSVEEGADTPSGPRRSRITAPPAASSATGARYPGKDRARGNAPTALVSPAWHRRQGSVKDPATEGGRSPPGLKYKAIPVQRTFETHRMPPGRQKWRQRTLQRALSYPNAR